MPIITDVREGAWFALSEIPQLAFDHDQILQTAIARLRGKIRYELIGFELLPTQFILSQSQKLYELLLVIARGGLPIRYITNSYRLASHSLRLPIAKLYV